MGGWYGRFWYIALMVVKIWLNKCFDFDKEQEAREDRFVIKSVLVTLYKSLLTVEPTMLMVDMLSFEIC